ncbi:putative F-box domain-containing protein [Lupinus albus]|uniref:Putative F-box domain-containing protein n=1 Tax=Lupinus albus TaxID=3870 RepID=A0A6A4PUC8_LUPAL|nr:putative F-box domain-containing protein [Lupinus albus]
MDLSVDLASVMAVCKQWRDTARDDYFWKCLCAKRWPSICKQPNPPTGTYYNLYKTFYKR